LKSSEAIQKNEIRGFQLMHSDEELVQKFISGETQSFRVLVERYKLRVYNIIYGMMGNRDEAEDLAQEVFISVYKNLHHFKRKSKFYTWLYRITVNICLSARRKRKNKDIPIISMAELSEFSANPGIIELTDESFSPQKIFRDKELAGEIRSAINSLSRILRVTFILREFEDLSYQELARIFHCSSGTIKSRLSRAREELRQKLIPYLR